MTSWAILVVCICLHLRNFKITCVEFNGKFEFLGSCCCHSLKLLSYFWFFLVYHKLLEQISSLKRFMFPEMVQLETINAHITLYVSDPSLSSSWKLNETRKLLKLGKKHNWVIVFELKKKSVRMVQLLEKIRTRWVNNISGVYEVSDVATRRSWTQTKQRPWRKTSTAIILFIPAPLPRKHISLSSNKFSVQLKISFLLSVSTFNFLPNVLVTNTLTAMAWIMLVNIPKQKWNSSVSTVLNRFVLYHMKVGLF